MNPDPPHTYIHTYIHTHTHTYIHTCIHTYMHTYIHAYMHTRTHTYITPLQEVFNTFSSFMMRDKFMMRSQVSE
jgi:hypothetical protein